MTAPDHPTRSLIIVRRTVVERHAARAARDADVQVWIVDRRQTDCRTHGVSVGIERRRSDRRRALTGRERELWDNFGYRLVQRHPTAGIP